MKGLFKTKAPLHKKGLRKEFLQNLSILFASILLFLIAAEGALRIFYPRASDDYNLFPQGVFCKPHPLYGWIGQPNVSGTATYMAKDMHDMRIDMNSDGFLDRSYPLVTPPRTKRLLFLGDSFTIGYGIPKETRFTDLITNHLASGYETINLGMWGYSTDQEFLVFKEIGLRYDPDVVILSMFLDDLFCSNLYSVNDGIYTKPKFCFGSHDNLRLCNVPVANNHGRSLLWNILLTRFYNLRNRMEVGTDFHQRGWFSVFDRKYLEQDGYHLTLRLVGELYAMAKEYSIKFLVVIIPWKDQLREHEVYASGTGYGGIPHSRLDLGLPQKVVKLFCRKMGIPVLDLLPAFKGHHCPKKLFFKNDCHWTKAGHRLAAQQILAYLQELNYL